MNLKKKGRKEGDHLERMAENTVAVSLIPQRYHWTHCTDRSLTYRTYALRTVVLKLLPLIVASVQTTVLYTR